MTAYAAVTSTNASYETIRDAATAGEGDKPARTTTQPYRETLEHLWIVDPLPGWLPTRNHIARLEASPKHQLADPAVRLLGGDADALLDARDLIWVALILGMLSAGRTVDEILADNPTLDEADIRACMAYGALLAGGHFADLG